VANAPAHLFTPRAAVRTRYDAGRGNDPAAPQYPRAGAIIDYWLRSVPAGAVTLDILDASGAVVHSYSSEAPKSVARDTANAAPSEEDAPRRGGAPVLLPKHEGLNRFVWDLTYPGPWQAATRQPGGNGPTAVPGSYRVRLTVANPGGPAWSDTQPLVITIDPRVARDGVTLADLREQWAHDMRVRDLVSDANRAVAAIRQARTRLAGSTGAAADTLRQLAAIDSALVTPAIRYSKPGLQAHITYLYGMTNGSDQKIGRDAIERYRVLRAALDTQLAALRKLVPGALAAQ
jgi:hypothetical protein